MIKIKRSKLEKKLFPLGNESVQSFVQISIEGFQNARHVACVIVKSHRFQDLQTLLHLQIYGEKIFMMYFHQKCYETYPGRISAALVVAEQWCCFRR